MLTDGYRIPSSLVANEGSDAGGDVHCGVHASHDLSTAFTSLPTVDEH